MRLIHLSIQDDDRGWRIEVGDGQSLPTRGRATPRRVRDALAAAAALRTPLLVGVMGDDLSRVALEEEARRALRAALQADPAIAERMGALHSRGADAVLCDCANIDLPWELLDDPPLIRLVAGPSAVTAPAAGPLRTRSWLLDPALSHLADALDTSDASDASDTEAALLVVVGHGDRGGLALEQGTVAAATAIDAMPRGARVALALSCGAGAAAALGPRLVAAGVPAVLAMPGRVAEDVALAAALAAQETLAAGATVIAALRSARAAVRALADPDPDARWHGVRLYVSGAAALGALVEPPAASHFPGLGPDAAGLFAVAARLAPSWGFFGIEALCEAMAESPEPGRAGLLAQAMLPAMRTRCARLSLRQPGPPNQTPRLRSLLQPSGAPLDLAELSGRLIAACGALLGGGQPLAATTLRSQSGARAPAGGLEVTGGPDDGLILRPTEGQVLGRDNGLYDGAAWVDARLSRQHLRWEGPGQLYLLVPGASRPAGTCTLAVGELLELGGATLLRGVA